MDFGWSRCHGVYVCADLVEVRVRRQESRKFACRAARTGALRVLGSKNGVAYAAACGEAVRPRVVVSDLLMDRGCAAALAADVGLRRVTLQEGLRVIGAGCFKGCGVLAVRLPASVREIGDEAFRSCRQLKYMCLAEGLLLERLGRDAFSGALEDRRVVLTSEGQFRQLRGQGALRYATVTVLPEGIVSIPRGVFDGGRLAELHVPASVQ